MSGSVNIWALVGALILVCYPVARILRRMGFSGWWMLLAITPIGNLLMLWVLAFIDWPNER